jgi:polyphosphate kinase
MGENSRVASGIPLGGRPASPQPMEAAVTGSARPANEMTKRDADRYVNRELSWLSFNERVLQEAADPSVAPGDRLNFLAIHSSNLDEFFRVRVASIRSLLRLRKKRVKQLQFNPARLLRRIHGVVNDQQIRFGEILRSDVIPALARRGIELIDETQLTPEQEEYVRHDFVTRIAPLLDPVRLASGDDAPFLRNRAIYLIVELWPREKGSLLAQPDHAVVAVPSPPLTRFVCPPARNGRHAVLFLDDAIRLNLDVLFPDHEVGDAYAVKLTRDAELRIEDEFSGSLAEAVRKSIRKRETGLPCRFLYDPHSPYPLLRELSSCLNLEDHDLVLGGRYHNLHDLSDFPLDDRRHLRDEPPAPVAHPQLEDAPSLLEAIAECDHLLHFPYHRFDYVVRLIEEAAEDAAVESISLTLYRVARDSRIASALITAAGNGKNVTVFVEVQARFDEASNLSWAERLEEAGVQTLYSMPGLKVHSKLALIERREDGILRRYAYLGTGNFNEQTARIYTDHALLTAHNGLTEEVLRVFSFLAGQAQEEKFRYLLVAPFDLRKRLYRLIDGEADAAKQGLPSGITLKLNSLEDTRIIDRLYKASRAGVPIQLVIRGICCLVPGVDGRSETIVARSIVDRFLEHGRIYVFENRGDPLYYLSSADWMTRNLSRRVEVAFPILEARLQQELRAILDLQLADNVKARVLDATQSNHYVRSAGRPVRSQQEIHKFFQTRSAPPAPALKATGTRGAEPIAARTP